MRVSGRRPTMTLMEASIDLYWIPLGAGGHCVTRNGRIYEALVAVRERRERRDLYHAALIAHLDEERYAIEVGPVGRSGEEHGVVASGAVGSRWLGWWRLFQYEVRCWRHGTIPDLDYALGSPIRASSDASAVRALLNASRHVPTYVWGRDELHVGDMWNSNSVVAWLLTAAGIDAATIQPPPHGAAPGWQAGVAAALRIGSLDADGRVDRLPVLGMRVTWREVGTEVLAFDLLMRAAAPRVPMHVHPTQEERITVLSGRVRSRSGGRDITLAAGEGVVSPPGEPHTIEPAGGDDAEVRAELRPALSYGEFVERSFALDRAGHVNRKGRANPLRMSTIGSDEAEFFLAGVPIAVQRALVRLLGRLGRALGYDQP